MVQGGNQAICLGPLLLNPWDFTKSVALGRWNAGYPNFGKVAGELLAQAVGSENLIYKFDPMVYYDVNGCLL